jgi:S1-C subfamily serine protease
MKESDSYEPLSQSSYFLEAYFNEQQLSSATCFFARRAERCYLITNWHVVSGKNNQTNKHLSETIAEPNKLVVKVFKKNAVYLEPTDLTIPLLDGSGDSIWLEHPTHGSKVDVVAIRVELPADIFVMDVESFIEPFNDETTISVKDDVFILGFPFGYRVNELFPIWKRASIASEPMIDIDDLPKYLVDTATRQGMSGSPVIKMEKRSVGMANGTPGELGVKVSNYRMGLAGIYSGRIGVQSGEDMQLGIVWKSRVFNEIIDQAAMDNG